MSLKSQLRLKGDPSNDSKWGELDLRRLFEYDSLCGLWNDLYEADELGAPSQLSKGK